MLMSTILIGVRHSRRFFSVLKCRGAEDRSFPVRGGLGIDGERLHSISFGVHSDTRSLTQFRDIPRTAEKRAR